jgi:hypothetical protein
MLLYTSAHVVGTEIAEIGLTFRLSWLGSSLRNQFILLINTTHIKEAWVLVVMQTLLQYHPLSWLILFHTNLLVNL